MKNVVSFPFPILFILSLLQIEINLVIFLTNGIFIVTA